ncbi:hypothetical protein KR044_006901 [Drosophila immigrans]|nr:hypothetical protein KR044_006901 [Drosophila immigrans]
MQLENFKYVLLICSLVIPLSSSDKIIICGKGLSEMMTRICRNGYNYRLKRTDATLPDYNSLDTENNDNALDNFDFAKQPLLYAMLGESARQQLLSTRRRRFDIVEECCDKPCSTDELKEYCL